MKEAFHKWSYHKDTTSIVVSKFKHLESCKSPSSFEDLLRS